MLPTISPVPQVEPPRDCPLCPRLVAFREELRREYPDWWNAPVPNFGDPDAWLAIVGLAPGKHGANRTGRPFTGDGAGWILYETLLKTGFARGVYEARPDDTLQLVDCMITNAVRCAPPGNKPQPIEEATCRPFLTARLAALPRLKVIVTLGDVSRRNVLKALGLKGSAAPPGHGVEAALGGYVILNSYHCSRLNTNTGRLTPAMFEAVFRRAREIIES